MENCPVCWEIPATLTTSCGHSFCMQCLKLWHKRQHTCPLCRFSFSPIEDVDEQYQIKQLSTPNFTKSRCKLRLKGKLIYIHKLRLQCEDVQHMNVSTTHITLSVRIGETMRNVSFCYNDDVQRAIQSWFHRALIAVA